MPWRTQSCSTDLHIRRAQRCDDTALHALWRRAMAPMAGFLGQHRVAAEDAALTTLYLPTCTVWIAQTDSPLGFLALRPAAEVAGLFVDPVVQGQGIGRALLDHVRGAAPLHLEVAAPNFTARRFYQRYGFAEIARRHDPDLDEELLHMRLVPTP